MASAFYHYGSGQTFQNAYFGWAGIDGEVDFPNHFPNLGSDGSCAHSSGQLGIGLQDRSWIQAGWFAGCFILVQPPRCRFTTLGGYVETFNSITGRYTVNDIAPNLPPIPPGSAIIFQIEYDTTIPNSPCWKSYWYYNIGTTYDLCAPVQSSGAAFAGGEAHTHLPGTVVEMPVTVYGNSNPNTNNGLRIKGGNGYVPWTTSLSSYTTAYYDERYGAPGACAPSNQCFYWISEFNANYKLESYGQNTG
jgi:hypothetical protein